MNLLVICKASTQIGFGHLIRSRTFVENAIEGNMNLDITLCIIGDSSLKLLLKNPAITFLFYEDENQILLTKSYDAIIFDTINFNKSVFDKIRFNAKKIISLSPVFNLMPFVDICFNRTQYWAEDIEKLTLKKYGGFEYALIQRNCNRIHSIIYKYGLEKRYFNIAISMGGGDAANKTLEVIKQIKNIIEPFTFWIMLGEGYSHSFDEIVNEIRKVKKHEIILAKTNHSMWNVLSNTSLLITTSGITSYEAAYAGLPTITFYDYDNQWFLLKELVDTKLTINGGKFSDNSINNLRNILTDLYHDRSVLYDMHKRSKKQFDNEAANRIINIIKEEVFKT
ncbi:MAG: hypothetical protein CVU00_02205 [Bacteroidetes bacterium HGW-Bacteroidetes-17]|jgi:spore coat polysaccharide biosynthesis predicted glycosyltransferase SpsG|nr:MAG: hypothetical protein CVU00_02205 [Bacteroidetes bacterium HGW-Bacteroidetes-17]